MSKLGIYDGDVVATNNSDVDGLDLTGATGKVKDGDNYSRSIIAWLKRNALDDGAANTVGGTADVITCTLNQTISTLISGIIFRFIAGATNTTNVTINVTPGSGSAFGAKAIRKISGGTDVALVAGDLVAGETYTVVYRSAANSAAGAWVLVGATGILPETRGGTNQSTYTQGDILYASAANTLSKLAKGTAYQKLRMNTGATAPEWSTEWEAVPGSPLTPSGAATASLTGLSAYRVIRVSGYLLPATGAGSLLMRVGTGGGPTYDSGANYRELDVLNSSGATTPSGAYVATNTGFLLSLNTVDTSIGAAFSLIVHQFNQNNTSLALEHGVNFDGSNFYSGTRGQYHSGGTARTAIQFLSTAGNITGFIVVEGLRG